MTDIDDFDPALFGLWPSRMGYGAAVYSDSTRWTAIEAEKAVKEFFLETKSGERSSPEELRVLLNEMTAELREEFVAFRQLRRAAEAAALDGDDAAAKLARADLKAAADAMSLIVRTLEKVDALQRQLLQDRELEAEQAGTGEDYEQAKTHFLKMIEEQAHAKARILFAQWTAGAGPPDEPTDAPTAGERVAAHPAAEPARPPG